MKKSALIIVDMVKDFTCENGLVYYPQNKEILVKIKSVLDVARANDLLIIFLQHCYRKDKFDKNLLNMRPNCIEGSGGEDIDDSLEVDLEKDYVIKKRRYSGFYGTDLDLVLRENGITNTIIVGTKTNCCIRATAMDAYYRDYSVIVLSDCVATNSEEINQIHLSEIDRYIGSVIDSSECISKIEKGLL